MQDLRARLRAATADEHRRTEASFAAALASLPDSYGDFLGAHAAAFAGVGRALEAQLEWPASTARWRDIVADLAALGLQPRPGLALKPAHSRAEALGMAYVLEGSRLGSAVLLKGLPPGLPDTYLRGGLDRAPWQRLQTLLGTVDPQDETAAVSGAHAAFAAFRAAAGQIPQSCRLGVPA